MTEQVKNLSKHKIPFHSWKNSNQNCISGFQDVSFTKAY